MLVPDISPFDCLDVKLCTSVGVLVHTGELRRGSYTSILFLEQLDVTGNPWGIPAGRTESYEKDPVETARRETFEETGLSIGDFMLKDFLRIEEDDKVKIVYSYQIPGMTCVHPLEEWEYKQGIYVTKEKRYSDEIGRMAFVPNDMLFRRGHPIFPHYYRWDIMHDIKAKLEGLRVI